MRTLEKLLDKIAAVAVWAAAAATVLMMLHVTADVIGRTLFNAPIVGTVEIVSAYHMAALAFLPLALITKERGHIIVELFTGWMRWRARTALDAVVALVTLVYVAVFTFKTIEIAIEKTAIREAKEAGVGFVEIWPSRWAVPLGFGLMALYVLVHIVKDLRAVVRDEPASRPGDRDGGL